MRFLLALLTIGFCFSGFAQSDLHDRVLRKADRLQRALNRNIDLLEREELKKIERYLSKSIQTVRGFPTETWTCSVGWNWNGPESRNLGSHTFTAEGESKQHAFERLVQECIASDIYLTSVRYCKREIQEKNVYCAAD